MAIPLFGGAKYSNFSPGCGNALGRGEMSQPCAACGKSHCAFRANGERDGTPLAFLTCMKKTRPDEGQTPLAPRFPSREALRAEVHHRFERLVTGRWRSRALDMPADIFVRGNEIWIEADVPGVSPEQVQAYLEGQELVIHAHREAAPVSNMGVATQRERMSGTFQRRLPLPQSALPAQLDISLEAGVLRVRVRPKEEGRE